MKMFNSDIFERPNNNNNKKKKKKKKKKAAAAAARSSTTSQTSPGQCVDRRASFSAASPSLAELPDSLWHDC
jgi:hypothetical protein